MKNIEKTTLDFYENNAYKFALGTAFVEFMEIQDKFLEYIPANGTILDFGCGSGRDAKYFLKKGYKVDATDGSMELCKLASEYTGINVKKMLFSELSVKEFYDGIWACSSILHLPKNELKGVLNKMIDAIKNNGFIYTSFKYGDFEGYRNERYFTDFTRESFEDFIKDLTYIKIVECWMTKDSRPDRGDEKWLNLIIQKVSEI